jgi:4-amino-4-deoxy-L-arabinose transferase-like glycosyltransferase
VNLLQRYGPELLSSVLIAAWLALALRSLQFFSMKDDEGTFLLTAQSALQGYALYREVWFNYLPGLIGLLVATFRIGGVNVEVARTVMVLFSALALAGVAALAASSGRRWAAPLAVALLVLTPTWVQMSRSVMAEVPANALLVGAALVALRYHDHRHQGWLIVAGLACGLAISFKYPTAIMLPIIGLDLLLLWHDRAPLRRALGHLALFGLSALGTLALTMMFVDLPAAWQQVVGSYRAVAQYYVLDLSANLDRLVVFLRQNNAGLAPAALLGLRVLLAERRPPALLFAIWLSLFVSSMLCSALLGNHHLYLLLTPLAVLAGIWLASIPALFARMRHPRHGGAALLAASGALTVIILVCCAPPVLSLTANRLRPRPDDHLAYREMVAVLQDVTRQGDEVVCDSPMIVFRAGRTMPPWLINTSDIRFPCAALDAEDAIAVSQADSPAAIVFWENKYLAGAPEYIAWVQSHYVEVQRQEVIERSGEPPRFHAVYLRPDLAP